jgi:hypothetical protein
MKTAVEEFRRQLALNHILIQDSEKVSIMISLSKFDELFNEAEEIFKQQIIDAFNEGIQEMIGRNNSHIMCKHTDVSGAQYYNETFNND